MSGGVLNEAYERFHRTGPEWGEDQLTNHGPMAVEVLVRRGRADRVDRWVQAYLDRLDEMPSRTADITDADWREALGDGRRVGDWAAYFGRALAERPWREVLATWWERLLPGIVAGTTHGVIRVGHVVRALLAGAETPATLDELAHGLAFWAARSRPFPPAGPPSGRLSPPAALRSVPRIPDQRGNVAGRFGQLAHLPGWKAAVAGLAPAATPEEVPVRLADLVAAATLGYLAHGHGQPVLLVHTATAPNAVLHTLPALPRELWAPSLTAIWTTTAAIYSAYAPPEAAPRSALPTPPGGPGAVAEVLERAVDHADEHVIKFTDTAAEVYTRTGNPDALAAALRVTELIAPAR
ncbi:questin oxidase family protein [Thermoactinospora rubra]|uniref:questin oxidase family protein n=1 Tax=Thermoactinospora rubra TaxID=1088767 RepID=UPI00197D0981|nr:questin oxidase family protein [Thermoactinospora rubra]